MIRCFRIVVMDNYYNKTLYNLKSHYFGYMHAFKCYILKCDLNCGNCSGILLRVLILLFPPAFLLVVALPLIFMSTSSNAAQTGVLSFSAGLNPLPRSTMSLFFLLVIFRQWLTFSFLPGGAVRGGLAHYREKADLISGFIAV